MPSTNWAIRLFQPLPTLARRIVPQRHRGRWGTCELFSLICELFSLTYELFSFTYDAVRLYAALRSHQKLPVPHVRFPSR